MPNITEDVGTLDHSHRCWGCQVVPSLCRTEWRAVWQCLKKLLSNSSREMKIYVHPKLVHKFLESLICNSQKVETNQMSINSKLFNELWYIPSKKSYSTIKRNGLLIHMTTLLNLQSITWSEKSQSPTGMHCNYCIYR